MSKEIMQIPVKDLLESLKSGYEEYRDCLANENNEEDLGQKGIILLLNRF